MSDEAGPVPSPGDEEASRTRGRFGAMPEISDSLSDSFAAAVHVTRMPMIITNPRKPDNPIVFANDAFYRLTGYGPEEVVGRNCRFLQGPESDQGTVGSIRAAIAAAEPIEIDIHNHRKDGTPFWNRLLIAPVRDAGGVLAYFFASQFDITVEREDLARLEADNAALMAELSGRLAERTGELVEANDRLDVEAAERVRIEDALRQSQKMEAIGLLTGGIAHDFNNLLGGILGSLELIQRRIEAGRLDGLERFTTAAVTSTQRAAALTHRLLAFARRQPLDPKRVEANRLVAGMEDLLRRTLGPEINLEIVLAGGLWPTLCDPNQLENAVLNLAINARDAMPDGGRLTIETANAHLDDAYARAQAGEVKVGQYIVVCVTDTGGGMSPDVIAKAFDPFFTTKPTGQGTGLGLSMLYGFVKQSQGHVRIYSEPGQGSTFRLYLPRHGGDAAGADAMAGVATPLIQAEIGRTVLVVEDEPAIRMLVLETLAELGYAALDAVDGPSGLRIVQSDVAIDLLITDVGLPGLNGRQLADAARMSRPDLPVLFMTGYAHNAVVGGGTALDPGMEILTKPFALDALAKKIHGMLEGI